jgi:hypothetical protein
MADTKISALTAATTPLAGTEVLPIVQSGATVKVANNDLRPKQIQSNATSGVLQIVGPAAASTRVMTTPDANFTVARTDAAQSFTGDQTLSTGNLVVSNGKGIDFSATPGTGTSELFADYEEGTWTPNQGAGLTVVGVFSSSGTYTKIGRQVFIQGTYTGATSISAAGGGVMSTNLPFTAAATYNGTGAVSNTALSVSSGCIAGSSSTIMYAIANTGVTTSIFFSCTYTV